MDNISTLFTNTDPKTETLNKNNLKTIFKIKTIFQILTDLFIILDILINLLTQYLDYVNSRQITLLKLLKKIILVK